MKVRIEDAGPCRKVMHVEAPADAVAGEYQDVVKTFAKVVKLPGFRAGKAPLNVVEQKCAKEIGEETKERLAPRFYREALKEKEITPVAVVDVRDMVFKKESGLAFNVVIDIPPDFKLPKYKRISLKSNKVEVSDKDVEEAQKHFLMNFAKFEDVSGRPSRKDDLVQVDYDGMCDGRSIKELAPTVPGVAEGRNFWLLLGEPEYLPGFTSGLVGFSAGEKKEIRAQFPADYHVAALAGKEAAYRVSLKAIRERVLPAMDGEFLKRFGVESESALREKIRNDLVETAKRDEANHLRDEAAKFLLENTDFDLPQSVVAQETGLMIRNILERITARGATEKQIGEQKDEILKVASQSSAEKVKISYILSRIADEEKISVSDEEVKTRIEAMSHSYNMTADRLTADLEKANGIERLKSDIRSEKTLDFLIENAKIKN